MKVSERQLLMLLDIAKDSIRIVDYMGGYSVEQRMKLVNEMINQQNAKLVETDESNNNPTTLDVVNS